MRSSLVCLVLLLVQPVAAQGATPSWSAQKCALYEAAWHQALETFGSDQMNYAFMAGNENFIASGCDERGEICPQSRQEFEVSDAIALALINGGTASTFLPFNCPRPEPGEGAWSGPALEVGTELLLTTISLAPFAHAVRSPNKVRNALKVDIRSGFPALIL